MHQSPDIRAEGLLKNAHLLCCAANRTAQCIPIYTSRFGFLRALHLNIFEQPKKYGDFNDLAVPVLEISASLYSSAK